MFLVWVRARARAMIHSAHTKLKPHSLTCYYSRPGTHTFFLSTFFWNTTTLARQEPTSLVLCVRGPELLGGKGLASTLVVVVGVL